jgi:hypothetical protein
MDEHGEPVQEDIINRSKATISRSGKSPTHPLWPTASEKSACG